ncbi:MAG: hypothetical protein JWL70_1294 [Acidimicrobiia bacterium]|nr:hypothetical protein [Acidimicrobiia bacterium]
MPKHRSRVWSRLLVLVLVPILGVLVFGATQSRFQWRANQQAITVRHDVDRLAQLMQLELAVTNEMNMTGALVGARTLGLDDAAASTLLHLDVLAQIGSARVATDSGLSGLGQSDVLASLRGPIRDVRTSFDAKDLTLGVLTEEFAPIRQRLVAAMDDSATRVDSGIAGMPDAGSVLRAARLLTAAHDATSAVIRQQGAFGTLAVGAGDVADAMRVLHEANAAMAQAELQLDRYAPPSVAQAVAEARTALSSTRFQSWASAAGASAGPKLAPMPVASIAETFGSGLQQLTAYSKVDAKASELARLAATQLAQRSFSSLRLTIALTSLVVIGTLALVAAIAISIGRPLRRLADYAHSVSSGVLNGPRPSRRGPRELVRVNDTLDEVVQNLRLVEAQVGLLASGHVADPVLDEPASGRLGELVYETVQRLKESLSEGEQLARRLEHEATHDGLTQLANRSSAETMIAALAAQPRSPGQMLGVLYIDLDHFKHVNDSYGHHCGDALLRIVAQRLEGLVPPGGLVARYGGDEFLLAAEEVGRELEMLAWRVVERLSEPVQLGSTMTRVGASVGVAFAPASGASGPSLIAEADAAAYQAKTKGRGRVVIFDDGLRQELEEKSRLERGLTEALRAGQLELHYQPVISSADGKVVGVEALARWPLSDGTFIPPSRFIAIAENSDLVIDLGRWAMRAACRQLVEWQHHPVLGSATMSINLSGRHLLSMTAVDDLRDALAVTGADASHVVIEVTETVLLNDLKVVQRHLQQIRDLGCAVAIDDFGTGFTSLAHLTSMPVDIIKIDRSMVVRAENLRDQHLLQCVIDTAHILGLSLTAEGIETTEQLDLVRSLGCDRMQGYLMARPLPASDVVRLVDQGLPAQDCWSLSWPGPLAV